jgi:CDGSH-type Zn-finger protein/uncharacterized Fe-S cluster protein YjdI
VRESKLHRFESAAAVVTWDAARCIHAAECVRGLPEAFDPRAKPWIRPDAADVASLAAVVNRCPSGALAMAHADGASAMVAPPLNTAQVSPDGPNYLRGVLSIRQGDAVVDDTRIALCRCGASKNKPFCDNSHRKVGFKDEGRLPADVPAKPDADLSAPLSIKPIPNGPVQCAGPLTLRGSEGRTAFSDQTFLCRCGGSNNKPYCDGTHKKIGFVS